MSGETTDATSAGIALVGIADLEDRWGYTRPGVHKVVKEAGFPEPCAIINRGRQKVWRTADVVAFERRDPRFGGGPGAPDGDGSAAPDQPLDAHRTDPEGAATLHRSDRPAPSSPSSNEPPSWLATPRPWDGTEPPKEGDRAEGRIYFRGEWHDIYEWEDRLREKQLEIATQRIRERLEREGKVTAYALGYTFDVTPPAKVRNELKAAAWRYDRGRNQWQGRVPAERYVAIRDDMETLGGRKLYDEPIADEPITIGDEEFDAVANEALDAM